MLKGALSLKQAGCYPLNARVLLQLRKGITVDEPHVSEREVHNISTVLYMLNEQYYSLLSAPVHEGIRVLSGQIIP